MNATISPLRKASYALFVVGLAVVTKFGLGPALVAGLFAYMLLDQTERALKDLGASPAVARWASVGIFAIVATLLALVFASFIRIGMARMPTLLDRLLPRVDALMNRFGVDLPIENPQDLRALVLEEIRENARSVTQTSGLLTRGFFQILVALAASVLGFLWIPSTKPGKTGADAEFLHECARRWSLFSASFERVMGAQIVIAAINTGVTTLFLFAFHVPFRTMLTLTTFVCGMVPVVGNVVSNAFIVAAALTVSDHLAAAALVFLVVIHKLEYFLNGRIVGSRIDIPMWATLLGLLIGEALMGFTGVILAPTLLFYAREELRALPARG